MEGRADRALLLGICPPILSAEDRRRAWAQLSLPKPRTGPETASQACCKCPPRVMRRWVPPVWKRQVRGQVCGQVCACPSLRPVAPRVILLLPHLRKGPRLPAPSASLASQPLARARCSRNVAEHTARSLAAGALGAVGGALPPGPRRACHLPPLGPASGPRGGARSLRWAGRRSLGLLSLSLQY